MTEFTSSCKFAIDGGQLYAKDSGSAVIGHTVDVSTTKLLSVPGERLRTTFYLVKSNQKYFKDCLETAEDLICNSYPGSIQGTIRSKVALTGTEFGDSSDGNKDAARAYKRDYASSADKGAKPAAGQAYVIVSLSDSTYPYHAAAVIAADGDDRVTLEVFAANTDASTRDQTGTYSIYSVEKDSGKTFHDAYKDNSLLSENSVKPVTIVIEKK